MAVAEGITEELKRQSQWEWIRAMNSITNHAEEIIKSEIFISLTNRNIVIINATGAPVIQVVLIDYIF